MKKSTINQIIAQITGRKESHFKADLAHYRNTLEEATQGRSALVIGGAGSIGSAFIKSLLHYPIKRLLVVDLSENDLAELIRDIRSTPYAILPEIKTHSHQFRQHYI